MHMDDNNQENLGKIIRQQRGTLPLTFQQLATTPRVSASHLGCIERGNRFPSARILHKIARPLRLGEQELFTLDDYLSPQTSAGVERSNGGQFDPYVATVLT